MTHEHHNLARAQAYDTGDCRESYRPKNGARQDGFRALQAVRFDEPSRT